MKLHEAIEAFPWLFPGKDSKLRECWEQRHLVLI